MAKIVALAPKGKHGFPTRKRDPGVPPTPTFFRGLRMGNQYHKWYDSHPQPTKKSGGGRNAGIPFPCREPVIPFGATVATFSKKGSESEKGESGLDDVYL